MAAHISPFEHACGACSRPLLDARAVTGSDLVFTKPGAFAITMDKETGEVFHRVCYEGAAQAQKDAEAAFAEKLTQRAPARMSGSELEKIAESGIWAKRFRRYGDDLESARVAGPLKSDAFRLTFRDGVAPLYDSAVLPVEGFAVPVLVYRMETNDVGRALWRDYHHDLAQGYFASYAGAAEWRSRCSQALLPFAGVRGVVTTEPDTHAPLLVLQPYLRPEVLADLERRLHHKVELAMLSDGDLSEVAGIRTDAREACGHLANYVARQMRTHLTLTGLRAEQIGADCQVQHFKAVRLTDPKYLQARSRSRVNPHTGALTVDVNCVGLRRGTPLAPHAWVALGGSATKPVAALLNSEAAERMDELLPLQVLASDRRFESSRVDLAPGQRPLLFLSPNVTHAIEAAF